MYAEFFVDASGMWMSGSIYENWTCRCNLTLSSPNIGTRQLATGSRLAKARNAGLCGQLSRQHSVIELVFTQRYSCQPRCT
jgi:hypothetical protein